MPNFTVNTDDRLFRIRPNTIPDGYGYSVYGLGESGRLEITLTAERYLVSIDCYELEKIHELPIFLPGIQECAEDGAGPIRGGKPYESGLDDDFSFECILNKDGFAIVFSDDLEPCFYCKEGRVEYLYDEFMCLSYIKVVDLTDEEYAYLKQFCKE